MQWCLHTLIHSEQYQPVSCNIIKNHNSAHACMLQLTCLCSCSCSTQVQLGVGTAQGDSMQGGLVDSDTVPHHHTSLLHEQTQYCFLS